MTDAVAIGLDGDDAMSEGFDYFRITAGVGADIENQRRFGKELTVKFAESR
jgi:hypothetical protein